MFEMKYRYDQITSDFTCKHCHHYVTTDPVLSGVNNRNHCPYCLWSKCLDLYEPGDRLSACKAEMQPVGLTLKQTKKKYGKQQGELMVIHVCLECDKVSINRIAADDDPEGLIAIFENSWRINSQILSMVEKNGVQALNHQDEDIVRARLYGWQTYSTVQQMFA